jgi:hypothetical protein
MRYQVSGPGIDWLRRASRDQGASRETFRQFTGDDYEVAHVPADARAVLARFDERSPHYEVLLIPGEE